MCSEVRDPAISLPSRNLHSTGRDRHRQETKQHVVMNTKKEMTGGNIQQEGRVYGFMSPFLQFHGVHGVCSISLS